MKRLIIIIIIILIGAVKLIGAQTNVELFTDEKKVPKAPILEWPIDKPKGFRNFAQELIFDVDKKKLNDYLDLARAYYIAGHNGMLVYLGEEKFKVFKKITGIKIYEPDLKIYDLYNRDPYKFEIFTGTGFSVLRDFIEAKYCFIEAYSILINIGNFDRTITTKELYKELIDNIIKSLIYCNVHINNYKKALAYIDEYKKIRKKDDKFIIEWEIRIYGVLVSIAKKYDWSFTGDKSYKKLKEKHRELLITAIEYYYPGESDLKEVLKKQIYPEFIYEPVSETNK